MILFPDDDIEVVTPKPKKRNKKNRNKKDPKSDVVDDIDRNGKSESDAASTKRKSTKSKDKLARIEFLEKKKQVKLEKQNARAKAERAKQLELLRHRRQHNDWSQTLSDDEDADDVSGSGSHPLPNEPEESLWFRLKFQAHEEWSERLSNRDSLEFKRLAEDVERSVKDEIQSFPISSYGLNVKLLNAE